MNLTELLMERLSDRECSRCGRRLTDPASIEDGIGPVCKKHNEITINYGIIRLGHHPERVDKTEAFEKFFGEFPQADIVVISGDYWYEGYFNSPAHDYPLIFVDGEGTCAEDIEVEEENIPTSYEKFNRINNILKNPKVKMNLLHADSKWLGIVGTEYYIGPTNLSYEEFRDERGWAPGMCACIGDYEWYQEEYQEAMAHIEKAEPGPLTELLFKKMENKLWQPEYWEDFFEDSFIDYIENGDYQLIV
tara:strand:- start:4858 stop:5601 length:744 start_codon:yes stop_codon:yes gene_type:complete